MITVFHNNHISRKNRSNKDLFTTWKGNARDNRIIIVSTRRNMVLVHSIRKVQLTEFHPLIKAPFWTVPGSVVDTHKYTYSFLFLSLCL